MEEINHMYLSSDYKNLMRACEDGDKEEIEAWYTQLCMGYSASMMNEQIGTLEKLISKYCK